MSFVNEIAFKEVVNDLRVDENLNVEGTANVANLNVENITVTGQISGLQPHTTFQVQQGDDEVEVVELTEKIALMDEQIGANATQAGTNASSLVNKANKLNPEITYESNDPNYITFKRASDASETTTLKALLASKVDTSTLRNYATTTSVTTAINTAKDSIESDAVSAYETKTNVNAKFNHPVFGVEDNYLPGQEIKPLEDIRLSVTKTLAVNGQEITNPPYTTNLRTVLDDRYAIKTTVTSDINTSVQTKVNRINAEVEGTTLQDALKIILIPDPLQPSARSETNLQTLLDAKPSSGEVYTKDEINDLLSDKQDTGSYATTVDLATKQDSGSYATTQQLTDGLALKQETGSYVTTQQLTDSLALKQDSGSYVLTETLNEYATSQSVTTLSQNIQSLASTTYVNDNFVKTDNHTFVSRPSDWVDGTSNLETYITLKAPATDISGKVDKPENWNESNDTLTSYIENRLPNVTNKVDKPTDWNPDVNNLGSYIDNRVDAKLTDSTYVTIEIKYPDGITPTQKWLNNFSSSVTVTVESILNETINATPTYETDGADIVKVVYSGFGVTDIGRIKFVFDTSVVTVFSNEIVVALLKNSTEIYASTQDEINQASGHLGTSGVNQLYQTWLPINQAVIDTLSYIRTVDKTKVEPLQNKINNNLVNDKYDLNGLQSSITVTLTYPNRTGIQYSPTDTVRTESRTYTNFGFSTREHIIYSIMFRVSLAIDDVFDSNNISYLPVGGISHTVAASEYSVFIYDLSQDFALTVSLYNFPNIAGLPTTLTGTISKYTTMQILTIKHEFNDEGWLLLDKLDWNRYHLEQSISRKLDRPSDMGVNMSLKQYLHVGIDIRIYPPTPFPYDTVANETSGTYNISGQEYGNGTYTLQSSGVLTWGYASHDVDNIMDEGDNVQDSTYALHIPVSTNTWILFKLPVAIKLAMYKLSTRNYPDSITDGYVGSMARDWDIEGRNSDSESWVKIDKRRDEKFYQGETREYYIDDKYYIGKSTNYSQFRFYNHRNLNGAWFILQEWSIWGSE